MKKFSVLLLSLCTGFFQSCISEEPLNSECDVEFCYVHLDNPNTYFYSVADTAKRVPSAVNVIKFYVKESVRPEQLTRVRLSFDVTPGAVVSPSLDRTFDFSQGPVDFTVFSEDNKWSRLYRVAFEPLRFESDFSFETSEKEPKGRYNIWYEQNDNKAQYIWTTGNPGFALSRSSAKPEEYPTIPLEKGLSGRGVKLETRKTGIFGMSVKMPIAAGNLFIGTFDALKATTPETMKATSFGFPFSEKPLRFTGYYKFKPGDVCIDRYSKPIPGMVDAPDAYAVLYRNVDEQGNPVMLYGDDVLTNPNIVALARVPSFKVTGVGEEDAWEYFDIPFEYKQEINPNTLKNFGYSLTVVYTSSIEGALFRGAEGSTLLIDESKVIVE